MTVGRSRLAVEIVAGAIGLVLIAFAVEVAIPLLSQAGSGADWLWYENGLERLTGHLPIYDQTLFAAPYIPYDATHLNRFALIPPFGLTLMTPMLLLSEGARQAAWSVLMAAFLAGAFALVWPRRLSPALQLALVGLVITAGSAVLAQVFWANANALVAFGIALVWRGVRARSDFIVALGLTLAAIKITPAICLVPWVFASRGPRPIVGALAVAGLLTLPLLAADGPALFVGFIQSGLNALQPTDPINIAPSLLLRPALGERPAVLIMAVVGLIAALVAGFRGRGRALGLFTAAMASGFMIPGLWIHWFTGPLVALVAGVRELTARGSCQEQADGQRANPAAAFLD